MMLLLGKIKAMVVKLGITGKIIFSPGKSQSPLPSPRLISSYRLPGSAALSVFFAGCVAEYIRIGSNCFNQHSTQVGAHNKILHNLLLLVQSIYCYGQ